MLLDIVLTGQGLALSLMGIVMLVVGIIFIMRMLVQSKSQSNLTDFYQNQSKTSPLVNRSKYDAVNAFKWSGTFLNLGLVLAIGTTLLAFSWTTYEEKINLVWEDTNFLDDTIETVPRTFLSPPPPPPPPPPQQIEEVSMEEVKNEPTFVDPSIEPPSIVEVPASIKEVAPPPPPPPAVEKVPEFFKIVEQMPRFPGCEDLGGSKKEVEQCAQRKLLEFIYKNIKYPAIARENGVYGTVVVRFMVETDGSISNTEVVRDIGAQCGQEVLRVVQLMNKKGLHWTPGMQRGLAVRVQFNLPVRFRLE